MAGFDRVILADGKFRCPSVVDTARVGLMEGIDFVNNGFGSFCRKHTAGNNALLDGSTRPGVVRPRPHPKNDAYMQRPGMFRSPQGVNRPATAGNDTDRPGGTRLYMMSGGCRPPPPPPRAIMDRPGGPVDMEPRYPRP